MARSNRGRSYTGDPMVPYYPSSPHIEAAKHLRLTVTRYIADRASLADVEEAMTMLRAAAPGAVTAEALTDAQIDAYQRDVVRSGASSAAVDDVVRLCSWARADFPSRKMRDEARVRLAAAINARHGAKP